MVLGDSSIFVKDSGLKGPSLIILGGVHGNEQCGVFAINKLKDKLKIIQGKVTFVIANNKAVANNTRFIDFDLNRSFDKNFDALEIRIANKLKPLILDADVLLDIHASTSKSEPFVICEPRSFDIVKNLPVKKVLTNLDEFHKGSTDEFMNNNGKKGICVECGYLGDDSTNKIAVNSILVFLSFFGMIEESVFSSNNQVQEILQVKGLYKNTNKFKLIKLFDDFETISSNTIIGHDGTNEVKFDEEIKILFASNKKEKNGECFVYCSKV